jgi:hypothetical protein
MKEMAASATDGLFVSLLTHYRMSDLATEGSSAYQTVMACRSLTLFDGKF